MNVILNGKKLLTQENISLHIFIENMQLETKGVAVAVNENVIPKKKWTEVILRENDSLLLIKAAQGG